MAFRLTMTRFLMVFLFCGVQLVWAQNHKPEDMHSKPLSIVKLDDSKKGLKALPNQYRNLKNLQELNLSGNDLSFLPDWFLELKKLRKLDLSGNKRLKAHVLFKLLSQLPNLQELYLANCDLMYLPVAVKDCKQLRVLDLTNNAISTLPPILEDVQWKELILARNNIDTLNQEIVYISTLKHLDLSFTKAISNRYNYYLLEYLTGLEKLSLRGAQTLPEEFIKVKGIQELDFSHSTFGSLPKNLREFKGLKLVNLEECSLLPVANVSETLGRLRKLKTLRIGHSQLNGLPYNITKLRWLKKLEITKGCFKNMPSSFKKVKFKILSFSNCSFINATEVFASISKAKAIRTLRIEDSYFPEANWQLGSSSTLKALSLKGNNLTTLPFNPKQTKLNYLNLEGNTIPGKQLKGFRGRVDGRGKFKQLSYSKRTRKLLGYTSSPLKPYKKIVDGEIGDLITLPSGTDITIDKNSFIGKGNKTVTGDVELHIIEFLTPQYLGVTQFPAFLKDGIAKQVDYAIDIKAYHDGNEVFFKDDKPLKVQPVLSSLNGYMQHVYIPHKKEWEEVKRNKSACLRSKPFKGSDVSFLKALREDKANYPKEKYKLKTSKVKVSLKRNKRRRTLNFHISPQLGYKENYFDFFGNKIKGYPELKNYKNIRWLYVGDSLDRDLRLLYFLSDAAKDKKLSSKSTFNFYVLDIKDIRISPNPSKDNYLLQFIQGFDTLNVEVLPKLGFLKPKQIQKWHKKQYKKYLKARKKREAKWHKMDSIYMDDYAKFEFELERYRGKLKNKVVPAKPIRKQEAQKLQSLWLFKPGLHMLSKPLILQNEKLNKPTFKLDGKVIRPKVTLVYNMDNGAAYWNTKTFLLVPYNNYIFVTNWKGKHYEGKFNKGIVELKLLKLK